MTSYVYCGYSGASWELNTSGQDACEVYAQLQGQCNSTFTISPVTSSSLPYTPPNNACGCNIVAYNLMAGCAWCQANIMTGWWLSVGQWEASCTTFDGSGIPADVSTSSINIPSWAFDIPTGTTWSPSQASSAAVPNGFGSSTTTRRPLYTGSPYPYDNYTIRQTLSAATIVTITLICLIVISILWCAAGCIAHCQRQTKRRGLYRPMSAYYLAQNARLYYGSYGANAQPGTFGSAPPLVRHPNQPQPPPSAHLSTQAFSPLRTSFIRSPRSPPAEMTQVGSTPLVRNEPAVVTPTPDMEANSYSPVARGGFGEASGSGRGTGGDAVDEAGEGANVQRTKSVSYGGHAISFYGAHMATVMGGSHAVEETPQSPLPHAHGQEETLTESKGKDKAT